MPHFLKRSSTDAPEASDEGFNASILAGDGMVIELSEFWSRLVRVGVLDAPQCQSLADSYRQDHGGNLPSHAEELARFLIKKSVLTEFQSNSLLAEQLIEMRLGPYLIRDPTAPAPLGRFAAAKRTTDGAVGVLLRTAPGNPWLSKHTALNAPHLQPFDAEIIGEYEAVFSSIGQGKVLAHSLGDQHSDPFWTPHMVVSLGIKIAGALSGMHDAGIAHGAVRTDRIWMRDDGEVMLLRDPSGPPLLNLLPPVLQGPDQGQIETNARGGWLDTIDDPSFYVAPERVQGEASLSAALPTASSDLYSLGCLLFRLTSGRYPIRGSSPEETLAMHATEVPEELAVAIDQGEKGDPLYRVLAYALAKSPEARFAGGKQLAAALVAVGQSLPDASAPKKDPISPQEKSSSKRNAVAALQDAKQSPKSDASKKLSSKAGESQAVAVKEPEFVLKESPQDKTTDDRPPMTRVRRKRKSRAPWVLAGLAGVVVLQTIALTFMDPSQPVVRRRRAEFVPPAVIPSVSNRSVRESVESDAVASKRGAKSGNESKVYQVVQDQGLLYVPPTHASSPDSQATGTQAAGSPPAVADPITLDLLPPGPAMVVSVRLADVQASAVGRSMQDAFSPELEALLDSMIARIGVSTESVSRVTAAFYSGSRSGELQVAFSVSLEQPLPMETLLKAWDVSAARTREGQTIYVGDEPDADAFYLPVNQAKAKRIRRFAVGAIDAISDLASIDGEPIPLPRSSKSLWDSTNQNADICVLVTSNFLFADGRSLLQRSVPQAIEPLRRLLIPHTSSVLLVAESPMRSDGAEQIYSEIRFSASGGITEASLANLVRRTIEQWPGWANEFSTAARPDESWQPLAQRLPSMVQFVANRIRVGVDDRTAVANLYLPSVAASQISLGAVLAMNTPLGGIAGAVQPSGETLTIDQILDRPMSVSFGQESLEFAIDAIVDSLGQQLPPGNQPPVIRIIGSDLQLMGITQNQQIRDFAKQDLPLRQVLTDLVVAANPDKSSTGPSDSKQSLVWVVAGEKDDRQILVTTRQASQTKKYELPPEFQP